MRWLVALDEPLPNHDTRRWRAIYAAAVRALGVEDDYDKHACDAVRLSFLPQVQASLEQYATIMRFSGHKLSIQELEAAATMQSALSDAQHSATIHVQKAARDQEAYESALTRAAKQIATAKSGERNVTLNRTLFRLASKYGHVLDRDQVLAVVQPALKKSDTDPDKRIDYGAAMAQVTRSLDDGCEVNRQHRESWQGVLSLTDRGMPASTQANVNTALAEHPDLVDALGWDERSGRPMVLAPVPWEAHDEPPNPYPQRRLTDMDAGACVAWLRDELQMDRVSLGMAHEGLLFAAHRNPFDPFKDWLESLEWDGEYRLDGWLQRHAEAEDAPVLREFFTRWMISAVARTYQPGCQADYTLVLEGDQGVRKSSLLAHLAGEQYFQDSILDINSKDAKLACHGPVIIEFGELRNLTNKEVEHVKAFLTCRVDRFRPPYARNEVELPRRCVFAASTNDAVYLRDTTGNRRFWPVRVGRVDYKRATADRDQLWAEAVAMYRAGERWYLSDKFERKAQQEQAARRLAHPWEGELQRKLEHTSNLEALQNAGVFEPGQFENGVLNWISGELALRLIGVERARMQDSQQVARVLQALGWSRVKRRFVDGEQPVWRYVPPEG